MVLPPLEYPSILAPAADAININSQIMQIYLNSLLPGERACNLYTAVQLSLVQLCNSQNVQVYFSSLLPGEQETAMLQPLGSKHPEHAAIVSSQILQVIYAATCATLPTLKTLQVQTLIGCCSTGLTHNKHSQVHVTQTSAVI
jgi:hypothetical protein